MKQVNEARALEDGAIDVKHEVEIVCTSCSDPVSAEEKETGVCTSCGSPWAPSQSVKVFVTSLPSLTAVVTTFI
jgi:Zn finger protein HypA/HybF involved in hydrogenase expression